MVLPLNMCPLDQLGPQMEPCWLLAGHMIKFLTHTLGNSLPVELRHTKFQTSFKSLLTSFLVQPFGNDWFWFYYSIYFIRISTVVLYFCEALYNTYEIIIIIILILGDGGTPVSDFITQKVICWHLLIHYQPIGSLWSHSPKYRSFKLKLSFLLHHLLRRYSYRERGKFQCWNGHMPE